MSAATVLPVPTATPARLRLVVRNAPAAVPQGIEVLSGRQSFVANLFCRNHAWTRPFTMAQIDYASAVEDASFNSHQCCTKCGGERLFDSATMTPGPMFRQVFGR